MAVYLGKRWAFWFNFHLTGYYKIIYWVVVVSAGLSLVFSRVLDGISSDICLFFNVIFAVILCSIFILLIFDAIYLLSKNKLKPNLWLKIIYISAVLLLFYWGHKMAISPKPVYYQVKIDKPAHVEHLRIVQLSDIHINELTSTEFIQQMIDKVNQLHADFIVITGDTLDKRLAPFIEHGFDKQLQQLKSKYGTYVIFGNHEYLNTRKQNNREEDIIHAFRQANMKVLKDDIVYLDDVGITLIGRDDFSSALYDVKRATLDELMMFANTNTPVILLDHQPKDLTEPEKLGVDLMISGHTHAGQIFPINLIEKLMYKNAYGLYQNEEHHFTSIVSSGYGFWGPPIRLMTRSEIVVIDVAFEKHIQ
ncbi:MULTISPECIES: metallophosphoesterase [unclassified Gilliamella]|uniref:metallophosphoesterase n=1 Tax=unclassified Gilliamella TaxID=2685620 RepID=UPI001308078D|nr:MULTISPECIES: metallophosphoesterase [unclassified Gilliamella]MWP48787.1 hypothetical protein [Gilliamella sp. Lep-s35]MWP68396.1 hypothetical protein [Gilliamella sp. Lep-s5]MWP77058.1 hypothetical protein [Gilliamella sp. Lep-s21]